MSALPKEQVRRGKAPPRGPTKSRKSSCTPSSGIMMKVCWPCGSFFLILSFFFFFFLKWKMIYQSSCLNTTPSTLHMTGCKFLKHHSDIILEQSLEPGGGGADVSSATAASMVSSTGTGSGSMIAEVGEKTQSRRINTEMKCSAPSATPRPPRLPSAASQFLEVHPQIAPPGPELGRVQAGLREVDGPVIEGSKHSGSYRHTPST